MQAKALRDLRSRTQDSCRYQGRKFCCSPFNHNSGGRGWWRKTGLSKPALRKIEETFSVSNLSIFGGLKRANRSNEREGGYNWTKGRRDTYIGLAAVPAREYVIIPVLQPSLVLPRLWGLFLGFHSLSIRNLVAEKEFMRK